MEKQRTKRELIKAKVIAKAAYCYNDKSANEAANYIYASMTEDFATAVDSVFPSYAQDGGDKACRAFARWIKADRK